MNRKVLKKIILDANCLGLNEVNLRFNSKKVEEVLDKYLPKEAKKK